MVTDHDKVVKKMSENLVGIGYYDLSTCTWCEVKMYSTQFDLDMILVDATNKSQVEMRQHIDFLNRLQVSLIYFYFTGQDPDTEAFTSTDKGFCFFVQELDAIALQKFLYFSTKINKPLFELGEGRGNQDGARDLLIRVKKTYVRIALKDVRYVHSDGNYCYIVTEDKKQLVHSSLRNIQSQLPDKQFIRIHKQFLVRADLLCHLDATELKAYYSSGEEFPIGRKFKKELLAGFIVL